MKNRRETLQSVDIVAGDRIVVKTPEEIEGMRASCRVTARIMRALGESIRPGLTTAELDEEAGRLIERENVKAAFLGYRGFPAGLCVSVNEEVVHGIPGGRRLEEGQIVSLDMGVIKDGFYSDMAMTFPVGRISEEARRLLDVTAESLQRGIAQAKAGKHLHDIGRAVQECAEGEGFSVVRDFVGHGIGRSLWEEPQVPNYYPGSDGLLLQAGMTLAVEPMVNIGGYEVKVLDDGWTVVTADGSLSAHFEHTVVVKEDGAEILTKL